MLIWGVFLVVINIKQTVRFETRMKRDAHQAVFILKIRMAVLDVQKFLRVAAVRIFFENEDFSGLTDGKEPSRTVRRFAHPNQTVNLQVCKNLSKLDFRQRLCRHNAGQYQRTENLRQKEMEFFQGAKMKTELRQNE